MQLTRAEAEAKLEEKYLGAIVSIDLPRLFNNARLHSTPTYNVSGKIMKLAVEDHTGELIVGFDINHVRHKCDINYFIENITVHGNTHRADGGRPGVPEGD